MGDDKIIIKFIAKLIGMVAGTILIAQLILHRLRANNGLE